jgi:hypothetical protein
MRVVNARHERARISATIEKLNQSPKVPHSLKAQAIAWLGEALNSHKTRKAVKFNHKALSITDMFWWRLTGQPTLWVEIHEADRTI